MIILMIQYLMDLFENIEINIHIIFRIDNRSMLQCHSLTDD